MRRACYFFICWVGILVLNPSGSRADEPGIGNLSAEMWNWLIVDLWKGEKALFHVYADQRWAEERGSYLQIVSPRLQYRIVAPLDVVVGVSTLRVEPDGGEAFFQLRPEFELNPRYAVGEHWTIHNRNRLEGRWNDFAGKARLRSRHRLQVMRSIQSLGPLKAWYLNNEWFGDLEQMRYSENRAIPTALSFQLSEGVTLDLFYMIRSTHLADSWTHDHIAGTFLRWRL